MCCGFVGLDVLFCCGFWGFWCLDFVVLIGADLCCLCVIV